MIHPIQNRKLQALLLVFSLSATLASRGDEKPAARVPTMEVPEGFTAAIAAPPSLAMHPIMASLGAPGQLFVGDSSGTNLNKAGLEKALPHRVLLLTDTNADGVYDKASVFADKMTFPQGGVWLEGSFYVASPPGIWKLTDSDGDGVADQREMIVGGFEYTGNAADVHGPFLHPNGRLYWCHGRKGHEVKQKDGTLVHAGLASGIWSCRPDGSDVRWHALSCADNPTEIDFTPEGEIVGTVNLFYTGPRGDTLMHWLRGGVYPREDQIHAIAGLPRTLDVMPVAYNFGHIAISGCAFYRSGALNPDWRGNLFVVHFNTQRVTRMELAPSGATYRITEREFLKLRDPDAHLTDVLEDRDGSLLVVDTGGWFRIGCPASLVAKPEVAGAIYRIRRNGGPIKAEPWGTTTAKVWELARAGNATGAKELISLLDDKDASVVRAAGNALASLARSEAVPALVKALSHPNPGVQLAAAHALGEIPSLDPKSVHALLRQLEGDIDESVEHQVMFTLVRSAGTKQLVEALRNSIKPALQRRVFAILDQLPESPLSVADALPLLDSQDAALAHTTAIVAAKHRDWAPAVVEHFSAGIKHGSLSSDSLSLLEIAVKPWLAEPSARELVSVLAESAMGSYQRAAWRILAASGRVSPDPRWTPPLKRALVTTPAADLPLLLDAMTTLATPDTDAALKEFAADEQRPLTLRLKAVNASTRPGARLTAEASRMLLRTLTDQNSIPARLEAARILARAKLSREQMLALAPVLGAIGPLELRVIAGVIRSAPDVEVGKAFAVGLTRSAALASFQESEIRTFFGNLPPECYAVVAPALREMAAEDDARRRKLETLPALISSKGRATEGAKGFAAGKGACIACHRIGNAGNLVGPDLSQIGQIRTERDLLESILFPSATLARDYEAHAIDTTDGQSLVAVIRRNLSDAIVVADASGQELTLPRARIASMQTLPTSLMPTGLDHALSEEELLDLIAYLRSCR
jgi:putative membrane-bound dehydrogenase-like protein